MVAKNVHTLISRTCECRVIGKKDFAGGMKVQTIKQIILDSLSGLSQIT